MTEATSGNTTLSEALAFDIQERRKQSLKSRINISPRRNPIMSDIGECERQMVYAITDWDKRPPHDENLQARFDAGNLQEREIISELTKLGYDVSLSQMPVEIKHKDGSVLASGRIDGFIKYHGVKIPIEIKSMNPAVFDGIETVEDLQKKPYLRKYIRQLMLYCYGNNIEEGLFILTNCLGAIKAVPITLDYGECEAILKKLESVHEHLKNKTQPDRIPYREEICGWCPFAMICLADVVRTEAEVLTNDDLLMRLEQRESLKEASSQYDRVDKSIKDEIKKAGIKKGIAGEFLISTDTYEKKEFTSKACTVTKVTIQKLKKE